MMQALMDIGVRQEDITTLLRTLSGILWLGNLKIEAVHANDSSRIKADAALSNASDLLGLEQGALVHAITHKEVRGNGAWVQLGAGGWTARLGCKGQQPRCACPLRLCSRAVCGGHASDQCCMLQLQLATPYLLCGMCDRRYDDTADLRLGLCGVDCCVCRSRRVTR